ncbi:MAG: hypothetical protein PWP16_420 [Eubacteriaceae bacterium]|jgi:hypothetical protein|nr:hypothetical protein [Eubacteriaceae bacterium]MDN5307057.1 hypothetical protein [Eubacteriaceae bacterium]
MKKLLLVFLFLAVFLTGYMVSSAKEADDTSAVERDAVIVQDMTLTNTDLLDSLDVIGLDKVNMDAFLIEDESGSVTTVAVVRQDGYKYLYLQNSMQTVEYIYDVEDDLTYLYDVDNRNGMIQAGDHSKLGYDAIGLSLADYLSKYKSDIISASVIEYIDDEKVLYIEADRETRSDHMWYSLKYGELLKFENYRYNDLVITMTTNSINTQGVGSSLFDVPDDVGFIGAAKAENE